MEKKCFYFIFIVNLVHWSIDSTLLVICVCLMSHPGYIYYPRFNPFLWAFIFYPKPFQFYYVKVPSQLPLYQFVIWQKGYQTSPQVCSGMIQFKLVSSLLMNLQQIYTRVPYCIIPRLTLLASLRGWYVTWKQSYSGMARVVLMGYWL